MFSSLFLFGFECSRFKSTLLSDIVFQIAWGSSGVAVLGVPGVISNSSVHQAVVLVVVLDLLGIV